MSVASFEHWPLICFAVYTSNDKVTSQGTKTRILGAGPKTPDLSSSKFQTSDDLKPFFFVWATWKEVSTIKISRPVSFTPETAFQE